MLTIAVAALAMLAPAKQQANYILPLYDLCTSVDASGNVTANFMLSTTWNSSVNISSNFRCFFNNGNTSAFSPNGNWTQVNPNGFTPIYGSRVTMTFNANQFNGNTPRGTLWIMYIGNANECSNGAESSVVATSVGLIGEVGHGGRPGLIVPIKDVTPNDPPIAQNYNVPINFNIYSPYSGNWNTSAPQFWVNNGANASIYPGNGWQSLNTTNLTTSNGSTQIHSTGHPNANAGQYCVGSIETYMVPETYNPHQYFWTEFSGIIRPYTAQ